MFLSNRMIIAFLVVASLVLVGAQATRAAEDGKLEKLMDPSKWTAQAPESFKVEFETSKGDFVVEVTRSWSPLGADRFYNLVTAGYFDDVRFFRVLDGFVAQFGLHGDPAVGRAWRDARIKDDPVKESNKRGYVTYAKAGPDTRTTQIFINYRDNSSLDGMGFSPFGKIVEGMEVVDRLYSGYGEGAPSGSGPSQAKIMMQGNEYLAERFDKLDYVKHASLVKAK